MQIRIFLPLLPVMAFFAQTHVFAQNNTAWKKDVARELEVESKNPKDTTLIEMMVKSVRAGKLTAYSNFDHSFTTKLTLAQFNEQFTPKPDTMTMTDPKTGKEVTKIVSHEPFFHEVKKYRLLENWTFVPATGNTTIHIEGFAPVKGIIVDGDLRGYQAIFWTHYNEAYSVITRYDKKYPGEALIPRLWSDYFKNDSSQVKDTRSLLKMQAIRTFNMEVVRDDGRKHHLRDLSNDTTLAQMIVEAAKAGTISVFGENDRSLTNKLTTAQVTEIFTSKPDTVSLVDPTTGTEVIKVVTHDFDYESIRNYRVLESWEFDPAAGNTEIKIVAVAPLKEIVRDDGIVKESRPVFWIRYADMRKILDHYEQIHPDNTLASHLWYDYFYSEVKPKTVK